MRSRNLSHQMGINCLIKCSSLHWNEERKFVIGETVIEDRNCSVTGGYDIIDGVLQVTLEDELSHQSIWNLLKVDEYGIATS